MAVTADKLHDEIDAMDEVLERAGSEAERIYRARVKELLREVGIEDGGVVLLGMIAREIEDKVVDPETSEAFVRFAELAQQRAE